MGNKLNGTSQIWADGYSFMEVTETLLTAMGIRMDEQPQSESEPLRVEPAARAAEEAIDSGAGYR